MPQFAPGEVKTAIAPIKAGPAGMSCEAELFLGPDDLTKIATSGRVPFVSAGETQSVNVRLPVTMPSEEGSYHGYIDVFTDGMRFLAYKTTEDVVIQAPIVPVLGGQILYSKWRETGTDEWHPFPLSVPAYTRVDVLWHIRNDSNCRATFTMGSISLGRYRLYPETLTTLNPGEEADLVRENFKGEKAGTSGTMTWYLAVLAGEVTSTYGPDWYGAKIVDSVTLRFSWY